MSIPMPPPTASKCSPFGNKSPQLWASAPGRVNIIGEHTDHQYYGVLPTCINRTIDIIGVVDSKAQYVLKITNEDPSFPEIVYDTYASMTVSKGSWGTYAIAAYTGLMEYMSPGIGKPDQSLICNIVDCRKGESCDKISKTSFIPKGLHLHVNSNLPAAAGVSSSSALCVCFIRAFIEAIKIGEHGEEFQKIYDTTDYYSSEKIAEFSVPCERHCGTASGGMDQAIICLGKEGIALNIDFQPLVSKQVDLPEGMDLIVANTGKKSAKSEMAPYMYNKRVFELRLGNLLLLEAGLRKNSSNPDSFKVPDDVLAPDYLPRLRDVERRLGMSFQELIDLCKSELKDHYTKDVIVKMFSPEKIANLLELSGEAVLEKNDEFKLQQPICHVLSETIRVNEFVATCQKAKETNEQPAVTAAKLGELMDQSHFSLRDQFFNSCDELEALTKAAREAGAYGARMTGAGWGGCCVIAIERSKAEAIKDYLLKHYYQPTIAKQMEAGDSAATVLPTSDQVDLELLTDTCFVVAPSNRATSGLY